MICKNNSSISLAGIVVALALFAASASAQMNNGVMSPPANTRPPRLENVGAILAHANRTSTANDQPIPAVAECAAVLWYALEFDALTSRGETVETAIATLRARGGANGVAILTDAFPEKERGQALGINMVAVIAGSMLGLTLGGVLAAINWRWIFLVNVPIGVFAFFIRLDGMDQFLRVAPRLEPAQRLARVGVGVFLEIDVVH